VTTPRPSRPRGEVRLRLDLAYDGTDFAGWAEQPGQRTVAGVLRAALETLTRTSVRLVVAGRTDAGVHARGQVAHVDVPAVAPVSMRALNGLLPQDVRVHCADHAPEGFDARFSAVSRLYAYRVTDRGADPLRRYDTLLWPRPLDEDLLRDASARLVGLHDFAAFCRRREAATTVRDLLSLEWVRDAEGVLTATVRADAFCRPMVRSLVGSLLPVGDGRLPVDWPSSMLGAHARADDVSVAPAHGLTLLEVTYPGDADLALRAELTRARRTSPTTG
jgi:tRNA pseudouridine38-40 synthase